MTLIGYDKLYKTLASALDSKKLIILYGPTGSGKSTIVANALREAQYCPLWIDSRTRRSIQTIQNDVSTAVYYNGTFVQNAIVADELECMLSETFPMGQMLSVLNEAVARVPVVLICHKSCEEKLTKLTCKIDCTVLYTQKPSIAALVTLCESKRCTLTKKEIRRRCVANNGDIRKLLANLSNAEDCELLSENAMSHCELFAQVMNRDDSLPTGTRVNLAFSNIFSLIPMVYENFVHLVPTNNHWKALSFLCEGDVLHTHLYSHQSWTMYYACVITAVLCTRALCTLQSNEPICYGSLLSKISNMQTKKLSLERLKSECKVTTPEQLFALKRIVESNPRKHGLRKQTASSLKKLFTNDVSV